MNQAFYDTLSNLYEGKDLPLDDPGELYPITIVVPIALNFWTRLYTAALLLVGRPLEVILMARFNRVGMENPLAVLATPTTVDKLLEDVDYVE